MAGDGDVRTEVTTTPRGRAIGAVGGLFLALSVLYARPVLLIGAAGLGAWLLSHALGFHRRALDTLAGLTVAVTVAEPEVGPGESLRVDIEATAEPCRTAGALIGLVLPPEVSSRTRDRVRLSPSEPSGNATAELFSGVTGDHRIGPTTVELEDSYGLFVTTATVDGGVEFGVESQSRQPHVGRGGRRLPIELPPDSSVSPSRIMGADLRSYDETDDARRIDWNVSARLDDTYIRKDPVDGDSEPDLFVVVDERRSMYSGPPGGSKLSHVRTVLGEIVDLARIRSVPVGLVTVTEQGMRAYREPRTTDEHYESIGRTVAVPPAVPRASQGGTLRAKVTGQSAGRDERSPGRPGAVANATRFDSKLGAFSVRRAPRGEVAVSPLLEAVDAVIGNASGMQKLVVFTDDTGPNAIRQLLQRTAQRAIATDVYLAPGAAFERSHDRPVHTDRAGEAFRTFETVREGLSRSPRARVFEVCPERWIEAATRADDGEESVRGVTGPTGEAVRGAGG